MDISVNKLLDKIGRELQAAKQADSEAKIREHAYAMKALCELVLEEPLQHRQEMSRPVPPMTAAPFQQQPMTMQPQKKLQVEDGANGDSIFDF
ncbi:YwdI family protein [Bacillus tuaregi]|uniref:YwdI family protein n=1 Tax=Bacillus tuaregi TaxID=1816695 RepID=UPI0008F8B8C6|nr:YwdI family protein [Bacillus tuaregi]